MRVTVKRDGVGLVFHVGRVNYGFLLFPRRWWWEIWKPIWHEGRGRYYSLGLWVVALYRGY